MNVLFVHNYYQQRGGEDQIFEDEARLLRDNGHTVTAVTVHNDSVYSLTRLDLARKTLWNSDSYDLIRNSIRASGAQIVHFHNTFPLISPAAYYAAADEGVAVVQNVQNYRLICPAATCFRDGRVCEDCVGKFVPWPAVVHRCYRQSRAATGVIAGMLTVHRLLGTWRRLVHVFIAATRFSRELLIKGGLRGDRIVVKPNFVSPDPGAGDGQAGGALFVGRLTEEKGLRILLDAWRLLDEPIPLRIVGDGPMRSEIERNCQRDPRVELLGRHPIEKVYDIIGSAGVLVFPSLWYEGLPRTIVESFAKATPVIASRLGAMAEIIEHGRNGWLFPAGDASALASRVRGALANRQSLARVRQEARIAYEQTYTPELNYKLLYQSYQRALEGVERMPRGSSHLAGEMTP